MTDSPKTLLKVLVGQHRWRYTDFEGKFRATAERSIAKGSQNPTVCESQFRRWTAGKLRTLPSPDTCRVLEAMFGVEASALFAPPPSTDSQVPAFNLEDEIEMTARDAQSEAGSAAAESISETTLDQLRDDVAALARHYNTLSAFDAFRTARGLREEAEQQRDRTQVPQQQQQLLILAGQACALLSAAAFDLGSLDGATRLARSAALYGETARFEPLRAFAGGSLAYIAYFSGRPAEAVQLAHRAQSFGGLGDVARHRLAAIEARAHGHLGNVASAQRAIHTSQEKGHGVLDELHDGMGGEFGFTPERLAMSSSSTCLLLGDGEQAEAFAHRALELVSARPTALRSAPVAGGASADLAMARLIYGDLDGAAAALDRVWTVPQDQRVTGLLARTSRVRSALTQVPYRGAALADELGERVEDFVRLSAQRQLCTGSGSPALEG
ncbi:DNA-binding protein [Streptomyces sp. ISL-98]|uniref:DNA-binding protein n=1 Tax=Streptomyces sp. ISL-98 TaxID=2819192 RepID=UPI001BEBA98C|nr:DNA-binding protein [Streptomyces sp. ISL-98]MBT2510323.1 DNA-binding protein [Streptomyces sp. ISL-98]